MHRYIFIKYWPSLISGLNSPNIMGVMALFQLHRPNVLKMVSLSISYEKISVLNSYLG